LLCVRGCCGLVVPQRASSDVAGLKAELLGAIGRRRRGEGSLGEILALAEALEEEPSSAEAAGRWSLVFSTLASRRSDDDGESPLQRVSNGVYETLFKVAPFLAGGDDAGVKNEQLLRDGRVRNVVEGAGVKISVEGTAKATAGDEVDIVFDGFQIEAPMLPPLSLPLPRPRGKIISTFVDADLRISRGSRGGLFILKRLKDTKEAFSSD